MWKLFDYLILIGLVVVFFIEEWWFWLILLVIFITAVVLDSKVWSKGRGLIGYVRRGPIKKGSETKKGKIVSEDEEASRLITEDMKEKGGGKCIYEKGVMKIYVPLAMDLDFLKYKIMGNPDVFIIYDDGNGENFGNKPYVHFYRVEDLNWKWNCVELHDCKDEYGEPYKTIRKHEFYEEKTIMEGLEEFRDKCQEYSKEDEEITEIK